MNRFSKISAATVMVLALAACGGGGGGEDDASAGASADVPLSQAPAMVQQYAALFNAARAQARTCGATPAPAVSALTTWNPNLQAAAQAHADDMNANNFFSHTGSNGSTLQDRAQAAGYPTNLVGGEVLAEGFSGADATVNAWLNSEGHCLSIMAPILKTVAVATAGSYTAADFGL